VTNFCRHVSAVCRQLSSARQVDPHRELLAEVARDGHTLATTALNVAELHAGMPPEEESRTENFIDAFDCYDQTAAAGRRAGSLKNKYARRGRTSHPRRYHRRCHCDRAAMHVNDRQSQRFPDAGTELLQPATIVAQPRLPADGTLSLQDKRKIMWALLPPIMRQLRLARPAHLPTDSFRAVPVAGVSDNCRSVLRWTCHRTHSK